MEEGGSHEKMMVWWNFERCDAGKRENYVVTEVFTKYFPSSIWIQSFRNLVIKMRAAWLNQQAANQSLMFLPSSDEYDHCLLLQVHVHVSYSMWLILNRYKYCIDSKVYLS